MSDSNMIMLESKTSEAFKSNQDFDKHPNRRSFVTLTSLPRPQRSIPNGFPASEPAVIEKAPLRFLITDSPSNQNIESHLRNLQKYKVKHVCKAANTTYSTLPLEQHGIQVHNLVFPDGDAPPPEILTKWLKLVQECFMKPSHPEKGKKLRLRRFLTKSNSLPEESDNASKVSDLEEGERISVHCVAGLGRGPVLVAVALIEFGGLDPKEAVAYIRAHRRGAINKKQYEWLEAYQPKYRTSKKILCPVS